MWTTLCATLTGKLPPPSSPPPGAHGAQASFAEPELAQAVLDQVGTAAAALHAAILKARQQPVTLLVQGAAGPAEGPDPSATARSRAAAARNLVTSAVRREAASAAVELVVDVEAVTRDGAEDHPLHFLLVADVAPTAATVADAAGHPDTARGPGAEAGIARAPSRGTMDGTVDEAARSSASRTCVIA